jgi:hypothetical protein
MVICLDAITVSNRGYGFQDRTMQPAALPLAREALTKIKICGSVRVRRRAGTLFSAARITPSSPISAAE